MNTAQLDTLIGYLNSALETLQELKQQDNKYDKEISATTTTVYLKTGFLYPWAELKKWCNRNNYTPKKIEKYGLLSNSYPASAWKDCFGIDLVELSSNSPLEH
ncbi:hypothetical protein [Moraxella sp. ZY200743]|uniref:hypothetical protein n=1 Tax=Moraxella sp. ZY200743 TaxID=2911970 RepID=UPI003D7C6C88